MYFCTTKAGTRIVVLSCVQPGKTAKKRGPQGRNVVEISFYFGCKRGFFFEHPSFHHPEMKKNNSRGPHFQVPSVSKVFVFHPPCWRGFHGAAIKKRRFPSKCVLKRLQLQQRVFGCRIPRLLVAGLLVAGALLLSRDILRDKVTFVLAFQCETLQRWEKAGVRVA